MSINFFARAGDSRAPAVAGGTVLLAACAVLVAVYARVLIIRWGQPQTLQDFSVFWVAGHLAATGNAAAAYDGTRLNDLLYAAFGRPDSDYVRAFFYPPVFFVVLAPLGLLPFGTAAAVWLGANLAAYLAAMRTIVPKPGVLILALAAPAVLLNLSAGQNGLLTAALLGGALALLDRNPIASGILIGLLAYKPQFGLLLPFFLAVTGRWRVFAAAALSVAAFVGIAAMLFDWHIFVAFAQAVSTAVGAFFRPAPGRILPWQEFESLYGMLRGLGIGSKPAWLAQIATSLAVAAAALRIATGRAPEAIKMATLATATMLVTPYSEFDDVAILMVPAAFLFRDGLARGSRRWEQVVLAAAVLLPFFYLVERLLAKALGQPQLASWGGMGQLMCAMLAALIGCRLARRAPTEAVA